MRAFLCACASRRHLDYDAIAALVAERFPKRRRVTAAEIATYLGGEFGGSSALNRLQRDRELAAWLREHKDDGRIDDVRAACIARFGAARVPSRTTVATFVRAAGRTKRFGAARLLGRDPELTDWVLEFHHKPIPALMAACIERFGKARTPSRSALWRIVKAIAPGQRRRPLRVELDREIADWLQANAAPLLLAELRDGCIKQFGVGRTPSISAIHRYLARLPGARLTRSKTAIDRRPEMAAWVREHRMGRSLDVLRAEMIARFGPDPVPSRSALHRFIKAERHRASGAPKGPPVNPSSRSGR